MPVALKAPQTDIIMAQAKSLDFERLLALLYAITVSLLQYYLAARAWHHSAFRVTHNKPPNAPFLDCHMMGVVVDRWHSRDETL